MLDKSKGLALGPELVTNGGFDSDTAWTKGASWTISAGVATAAASSATTYQNVGLVAGRSYLVQWTVTTLSAGVVAVCGGGAVITYWKSAAGTYSAIFLVPAVSNANVEIKCSGFTGTIDNISVRELLGNHASQPTATARPALQAGNKIDFDGVDDKLTTTFPDLGTAVTIVRSVPGTGASILTGQTIGAGARDDSTDHHGLLIINRALTAPETALVTAWANMRAGV